MRKKLTMIILFAVIIFAGTSVQAAKNLGYMFPIPGFSRISQYYSSGHTAIDIAANEWTPIYAIKAGTVNKVYTGCTNVGGASSSGTACKPRGACSPNYGYFYTFSNYYCNNGCGNGVVILHEGNIWSEYSHMVAVADGIYEGQWVEKGTLIGYVGNTGSSAGNHCHFAMKSGSNSNYWRNTAINPLDYMDTDDIGAGLPSGLTPVDLGTNFYTYILNQPAWKPIECDPNGTNVYLSTDKWTANQRWYATRNDDGSYTFMNAANNRCLDVDMAGDSDGTNVQAVGYNGSDAQKWFVYYIDGKYVFKPKCSNKVLDLNGGATSDGTNVQIWTWNGSDAQSFNIYKVECEAERPEIRSSGDNIPENGSLTVSWDKTDYTDHYYYYLTEYPEAYGYSTNTTSGTTDNTYITFDGLTSGKYSCFIHSVSHQGNWGEQSNWVTFNVYADDYIPTKTVVSNGHIYALYDYEMSWSFARDLCIDLGGHLVTVTSSEENQIITNLIQEGSKDAYWLGATDIDRDEKDYIWVTGEEFTFSSWRSGEPSASGEEGAKEHFAEIRKSYDNKWNDVNNINKNNKGFILEIEISDVAPVATEAYNSNKYLLFDKNTTWSEAKIFCEQLGGHLAIANDSSENEFIQDLLQEGKRSWYYLGGRKSNGSWKWIDGKNVKYISWADNASAWTGEYLMMYKSGGNCIGIDNAYYPEGDIKSIGFVCEIEKEPDMLVTSEIQTDVTTSDMALVNTVVATLDNISAQNVNAQIIFVYKYDDKSIAAVDIQKVVLPGKGSLCVDDSLSVKITELNDRLVDSIEVYVWEESDNIIPLAGKSVEKFNYN